MINEGIQHLDYRNATADWQPVEKTTAAGCMANTLAYQHGTSTTAAEETTLRDSTAMTDVYWSSRPNNERSHLYKNGPQLVRLTKRDCVDVLPVARQHWQKGNSLPMAFPDNLPPNRAISCWCTTSCATHWPPDRATSCQQRQTGNLSRRRLAARYLANTLAYQQWNQHR